MAEKTKIDINPNGTPLTEAKVRALIDESLTNYSGLFRVLSGNIQSGDFVSGSAGWRLTSTSGIEASSGTFRGTLSAASGTIGTVETNDTGSGANVSIGGNTISIEYNGSEKGSFGALSSGFASLDALTVLDLTAGTDIVLNFNEDGGGDVFQVVNKDTNTQVLRVDPNGDLNVLGDLVVNGSGGYTGDLKDSTSTKIADVVGGIITAVSF